MESEGAISVYFSNSKKSIAHYNHIKVYWMFTARSIEGQTHHHENNKIKGLPYLARETKSKGRSAYWAVISALLR